MEKHKISISDDSLKKNKNGYGYEVDVSMYNIDYISEILGIYQYDDNSYHRGLKYEFNVIKERLLILTHLNIKEIHIFYYSAIEDRDAIIDKLLN